MLISVESIILQYIQTTDRSGGYYEKRRCANCITLQYLGYNLKTLKLLPPSASTNVHMKHNGSLAQSRYTQKNNARIHISAWVVLDTCKLKHMLRVKLPFSKARFLARPQKNWSSPH